MKFRGPLSFVIESVHCNLYCSLFKYSLLFIDTLMLIYYLYYLLIFIIILNIIDLYIQYESKHFRSNVHDINIMRISIFKNVEAWNITFRSTIEIFLDYICFHN